MEEASILPLPRTALRRVGRPSLKSKDSDRKRLMPLLKKHAAIVHIDGSLSLLERKLYNALLLNAYDDLTDCRIHQIPVWMLAETIGFNSKNVKVLRDSLKQILTTVLEVNLLKDGKHVWETMALLSYARIEDGVCSYRYDESLASRLKTPEVYAQINMGIQKNFESSYALALYENCVRFRGVGATGWLEIDLLKMLLGAHKQQAYEDFKIFKRAVLIPAIDEVNRVADIDINPVFEKIGRTISRVKFSVHQKRQMLLEGDPDDPNSQIRQTSSYMKLRGFGIADKLAMLWVSQHKDRVDATLRYFEDALEKKGAGIQDKAAYLRAIFDSGVDLEKPSEQKIEEAVSTSMESLNKQRQDADEESVRMNLLAARRSVAISALTRAEVDVWFARYGESRPDANVQGIPLDEDGFPSVHYERLLFLAWLRGAIQVEQPTQEEIDAAIKGMWASRMGGALSTSDE